MIERLILKSFIFSIFMTAAVLISFLPLYFQAIGYSKVQIGLLFSIGPLVSVVANLFWGYMSDKHQTVRKLFFILFTVQLILTFLIPQVSMFALLYGLMMGYYFFQTSITTLGDSLTLLAVNGTSHSYASFRIWGSLGFAFSAFVFGLLLKEIGYEHTFLILSATVWLSLLLAFPLKDRQGAARGKIEFSGLWTVIRSRPFLLFMALIFLMSMAHRINDGFLALYLSTQNADAWVGSAWMISAISEIPVFLYLSKYGHKYRELPLLAFACFMYTLRFVLMSVAPNAIWVLGIQAMHAVTFGIFFITALRYLVSIVPDEYRASGQALYSVTWGGIAGLISGYAGGWVFDVYGPHTLYAIAAALSCIAGLSFLRVHYMESAER